MKLIKRIGMAIFALVLFAPAPLWAAVSGQSSGGFSALSAGVAVQRELEPGVLGVELEIPSWGYPRVNRVYPGSPAQQAGLQVGDVLIQVGQERLFSLSRYEIDQAFSNEPGVKQQVWVARNRQFLPPFTLEVLSLSDAPAELRQFYQGFKP